MKKSIFEGIAAGVYIGIGGAVFLACENKVIGSVFFTVALLSICLTGMQLFTGKVGMIVTAHSRADVISLFGCLIGNLLGIGGGWVTGIILSFAGACLVVWLCKKLFKK